MIGSELQVAIVAALKVDPPLCDARIYDNPPGETRRTETTGAAWPYITVGDGQVLDAGNTCDDGWEAFADVHVWSRSPAGSKLEAKAVMAEVVTRLTALSGVNGFNVIAANLETSRTFRDPNGATEHGIVAMRFLLDPA